MKTRIKKKMKKKLKIKTMIQKYKIEKLIKK